jgi:hypothetical protein
MRPLTKKMRDELSAHLDGESRDPRRVEALLRESEEARAYIAGLRRVSSMVQSLPDPVSRRNLARETVPPLPVRPRLAGNWALVSIPLAAAAVLLVASSALYLFQGAPTAQEARNHSPYQSPEALEAVLLARLQEGNDLEEIEGQVIATGVWSMPDEPRPWAEAALVGSSPWQPPVTFVADTSMYIAMESGLDANTDLHTVLTAMDQQETDLFRQYLADYVAEG